MREAVGVRAIIITVRGEGGKGTRKRDKEGRQGSVKGRRAERSGREGRVRTKRREKKVMVVMNGGKKEWKGEE